jgi:hypothetical protein
MHELCLPMGLDNDELLRLDGIIKKRRRVLKNDYLYRMGDKFQNLYAIRVGHFKTVHTDAAGTEQVTGFQMAGELLGFDAISSDQHQCNSIALEDSEVCEVPIQKLLKDLPEEELEDVVTEDDENELNFISQTPGKPTQDMNKMPCFKTLHGESCELKDKCPYSHDKELLQKYATNMYNKWRKCAYVNHSMAQQKPVYSGIWSSKGTRRN